MHELNFVDESFDLKLASEYHISIQVGLDGFSFCVLNVLKNKYLVFRHIPLIVGKLQFLSKKVESIFDQDEILNASYRTVSITFATNKATLSPKEYVDSSCYLKVGNLTNEISRAEDIRADDLPGFSYKLLYCYPKELLTFFYRKYTDFQFRHKSIILLNSVLDQRSEKKKTLLINFDKKYIRMIALKGMQISLFNSFYFKNESDFLYFTLNICHSLQFDAESDEIIIGGYVADDSSYVRQLKKYFSNVQFLKPSTKFNYGNLFEKVQKHQFVSLLNSYSCG